MIAGLEHVLAAPSIPPIASREDLVDALSLAAEIEHAIMCQYLFAAFSIDRTNPALEPEHVEVARTFTLELLQIARQEMAHLGMVTNLLIAIGAAPDFDRPNLPLQRDYYAIDHRFALMPIGDEFLALAAKLEEPLPRIGLESAPPMPVYSSVAAIYDRIQIGLATLGAPGAATAATLFCGAGDPQITNADFGASPNQVWYGVTLLAVTDLASALAAIALIRVQGEGATATDPDSHHAIVRQLAVRWGALSPAARSAMRKPVPANPLTRSRGDIDPTVECVVLRDPRTVALARTANRAYELTLLLLSRLYGANDATAADRDMYRKYAFFPLMTMVVRPVGEILTELPAGDGIHCGVCTFELDGPVRTVPDRRSFHLQLVERLTHLADGFAAVAAMPGVPARLAFVAQNVTYVRDRVRTYVEAHP